MASEIEKTWGDDVAFCRVFSTQGLVRKLPSGADGESEGMTGKRTHRSLTTFI
jgi:hypothetical protein